MGTQPGAAVVARTARPRRTRAMLADRLPAPVIPRGWKPRGPRNGLTFVDFLCGAGGSSAGLANTGWDLRFAANHWDVAIATHQANFPDVWHECADVTTINLRKLPRAQALWASPICTEASPAGGTSTGWRRSQAAKQGTADTVGPIRQEGMERTRATFWSVVQYAEVHRPELIFVENVPDVADRWALFDDWLRCMDTLGYPLDLAAVLSVNSAHIGDDDIPYAPQWRDRLYLIFVRRDVGRRFPLGPSPTSVCFECGELVAGVQYWYPAARKRALRVGRYRRKPGSSYGQYWYVCPHGCQRRGRPARVEPFILPAAAAIDWTDLGSPIGADRLAANTLRRIGVGQQMFWGEAGTSLPPFLTNANHDDHRVYLVDGRPLTARTTKIGDGLCLPPFTMIPGERWDSGPVSMADATRTQLANGNGSEALVLPPGGPDPFLAILRNHAEAVGLDEPMPTLAARGHHHALVLPYYSKDPAFPPTEPLGTVSTRDRFALVTDVSGETVAVRNCRFRMLRWDESAAAQCLPLQDGYVILGTGEERTAQAGNAVSMNASMWLGRAGAQLLEPGKPA